MLDAAVSTQAAPLVPLADLTERVSTTHPAAKAPLDRFTYIDLGAVDHDVKKIVAAQSLVGEEAPSRARQLIQEGDVLVSTVRPNLNGVALVPKQYTASIASTGFCVLRPKTKLLSRDYLFHWVRSPGFIGAMVSQSTGASYPAVSDSIVRQSAVPLPPLPEQHRIATILDQADALRAKRRAALAQLDEMAQAIFVEMFGDLHRNSKAWNSGIALGDVADVAAGITKGRKPPSPALRRTHYLAVANVQDRHLDLRVVKQIDASDLEIERYRLKADDLLLTEGGDPDKLGRGTLWRGELPECIHQNHVFRVRVNQSCVHPLYLNWLLSSKYGKDYFLRSGKQTTGIASINMTQLRAFPLLVPPRSLQDRFAEALASVTSLRLQAKTCLTEITALFASLQHRAFTGAL